MTVAGAEPRDGHDMIERRAFLIRTAALAAAGSVVQSLSARAEDAAEIRYSIVVTLLPHATEACCVVGQL